MPLGVTLLVTPQRKLFAQYIGPWRTRARLLSLPAIYLLWLASRKCGRIYSIGVTSGGRNGSGNGSPSTAPPSTVTDTPHRRYIGCRRRYISEYMATALRTEPQSTVVRVEGHVESRKACSMKIVSAMEEDVETACKARRSVG